MSAHFNTTGTLGNCPRNNFEGYKEWIAKLDSKRDNAPLEWIKNMILMKPTARLELKQLMSRIWDCDDEENSYFALCCDGNEETSVAPQLKSDDFEDISSEEGLLSSLTLPRSTS